MTREEHLELSSRIRTDLELAVSSFLVLEAKHEIEDAILNYVRAQSPAKKNDFVRLVQDS